MRKFFLLILFMLATQVVMAQQTVYTHDVSGNRIKRSWQPALPVTLVSFTATKFNSNPEQPSALLNWRTASEINSDRFDIQRSEDGKKWIEIGTVIASGDKTSDTDYSFLDEAPFDGENFYRLKMVDKDSTFTYSRIRNLDFRSPIVVYPNPVKGKLRITGILADEEPVSKVHIWDAAGRLQKQLTGVTDDGIDMTALPTGIYMVTITQRNGSVTVRKVVKE
jgi:hypothetical protein